MTPRPDAFPRSQTDRGGEYLSLRSLAAYSGLSVRTLRIHLTAATKPLPYYRIGGKILVRRDDFDAWASQFRAVASVMDVDHFVDDLMNDLR